MNRTQLLHSVGNRIIDNITNNNVSPISVSDGKQILKLTEESPFSGFAFAEDLCVYMEAKMVAMGSDVHLITSACMQGLGCIIMLLSSRISVDAAHKRMKDGDPAAMEKYLASLLTELTDNLTEKDMGIDTSIEIDEATKSNVFGGLDFGMSWKDDIN